MAKCPNISHPDWKALVNQVGQERAMEMYIENGYEIPNADGSTKAKKKLTVSSVFDGVRNTFKMKDTLDSLEKHPETTKKIIEELNKQFPWVKVYKDGIIDENGNYKEIPPGKVGMHYKSAVLSAIAYSNDSFVETIPHEYAHEYIEMYEKTPIVQEAIKKYGSKEKVVTLIGRKYAGQKMSTSFENFLNKFWRLIKRTFGSPDVSDVLTDSFAKNERLGEPLARGTSIYNYQDIKQPLTNKNLNSGIENYNEEFSKNADKIKEISNNEVRNYMWDGIGFNIDYNMNEELALSKFQEFWEETKQKADAVTADETGSPLKYAGLSERRVKNASTIIAGNKEVQSNILRRIKGEDVSLTAQEKEAYDTLVDLIKAFKHKTNLKGKYFSGNKLVDGTVVDREMVDEVSGALQQREENIKSKHPVLQWVARNTGKYLKHVTNNRLWAKYISGGENTVVSNLLHKALNNARVFHSQFINDYEGMFKNENKPTEYMDSSTFGNKNASIDELEHDVFSLDKRLNADNPYSSIQLTKSEQLAIFLTARQEGGFADLQDGMYLDKIKGRDIDLGTKFRLSDKQIMDIVRKVGNDEDVAPFIQEIDEAMEYSHSKLNEKFIKLEGYSIPKVENYFPKYHGKATTSTQKSKNVIEDMRSLRERTRGGAVRLADPFQVLSMTKLNNAAYYAYSIPLHNARKAINVLKPKFEMKDENKFIQYLEDTLSKVQDPNLLFSTQGEKGMYAFINRIQNNFTVALLAKNLGVVLKQQVSLETAATEINRKYIRKSGPSALGLNFINPVDLMRRLSFTGFASGETMMPVEWTQITEHPDYQTLVKNPMFQDRFAGMVNREAGEAIMGKAIGDDKVKLPLLKGKDGKPIYMTKSRLMMGITIMDTLTILRLYNAVKLETQDRMNEPTFKNLSDDQIEQHNINRLQELIDKTQPTFDQTNRTGMARDSNPLLRALTMFSSASQKMAMQNIDALVGYANNPTSENGKKFAATLFHTAVTTSFMLTAIDVIWYGLRFGFDDDDYEEMPSKFAWAMPNTVIGSIQGIGSVWKMYASRLDSNPWYQTTQDPLQYIMTEGSDALANLTKGNIWRAVKQTANTYAKTKGLPVTPYNNFDRIRKGLMKE